MAAPTSTGAALKTTSRGTLSFQQVEQLWIQNGGSAQWAPTMAAVAMAESGGNPQAKNTSGATGLFQVIMGAQGAAFQQAHAGQDMTDPVANVKAAIQLLGDGSGISNWGSGTGDPIGTYVQTNGNKPLSSVQAQQMAKSPPQSATLDAAVTQAPAAAAAPAGPAGISASSLKENYTGQGAYKGFDLSAISPQLKPQVEGAIDQYLKNPQLENQIMTDIEQNYGAESWAMNDPQVKTLLVAGSLLDWDKDPNLFTDQLNRTTWYKTTTTSQRSYQQLSANNPAQAKSVVQQASARVTDMANELGVQLTKAQLSHIATSVAKNSVDANGNYTTNQYTDQALAQSVSAEFNATSFAASMSGNAPAGTITGQSTAGQSTGDAAQLYNQFQTIAKNYYLPLTSTQLAQQVQNYMGSYTGQGDFLSGAAAGFTNYAKTMAQNLYPGVASLLGTTDASGSPQTPYSALAGYRTLIANYTGYQGDPDTIDLSSPQYSWILTGQQPPGSQTQPSSSTSSSSSPAPPTYDAVQTWLMKQPAYQTTAQAKQQGWQVGSQILKSFGYQS